MIDGVRFWMTGILGVTFFRSSKKGFFLTSIPTLTSLALFQTDNKLEKKIERYWIQYPLHNKQATAATPLNTCVAGNFIGPDCGSLV
jgi:hypothetical protein